MGLGPEMLSILEVELPAGDMSSMLEPETACASAILRSSQNDLMSNPLGLKETKGPLHLVLFVLHLVSKWLGRFYSVSSG